MADVQYRADKPDRWVAQYLADLRAHTDNVAVLQAAAQRVLAQKRKDRK